MEQNRLREEKKLQEDRLTLKERELQTLKGMIAGQPNCKVRYFRGTLLLFK